MPGGVDSVVAMARSSVAASLFSAVFLVGACAPRGAPHQADTGSGFAAERREDPSSARLDVGARAPAFTARAVTGEAVTVPAPGRATLLLFFATWSHPDLLLYARMQEIANVHPDLAVVGVGLDEDQEQLRGLVRSRVSRFLVVWDEGHALSNRHALATTPFAVVIDARGIVRHVHAGYREGDMEELEAALAPLVASDACHSPLVTDDGPFCFRLCERRSRTAASCKDEACRAACAPDACRDRCARENQTRAAALAVCRKKRPADHDACIASCHGEEMNAAAMACGQQAAGQQGLVAECDAACGIAVCRASCR